MLAHAEEPSLAEDLVRLLTVPVLWTFELGIKAYCWIVDKPCSLIAKLK